MGVRVSGDVSKKLKLIVKNSKDLSLAMQNISYNMQNEIRRNFDKGRSFDGIKWKKSARAKKEGGKTLQDTRRLYKSIKCKFGKNYARVGTNVIYARALNNGVDKGEYGKQSFTIPQHTRRIKKYKKNGDLAKTKRRITVREHKRTANIPWGNIPAYRYMGMSNKMKKRYIRIITRYITKNSIY